MKRLAGLIEALTRTESTVERTQMLAVHLSSVPADDAAWTLSILLGRRPRRLVTTRTLCDWALLHAEIPRWLFDESNDVVGDLAETVALVVYRPADAGSHTSLPLSRWMEGRLLPLQRFDVEAQRRKVCLWWGELDLGELYLLNKLLTGTLRVPIPEIDVFRSVSQVSGLPITTISLRLEGKWQPSADFFARLIAPGNEEEERAQPYPFLQITPLDQPLESLGHCEDWLVEWAFPGIRAQLIRRGNSSFLWSEDNARLDPSFPAIGRAALLLPSGTVLEGRIVPFRDSTPLPLSSLERGLNPVGSPRNPPGKPLVAFMPYDLLEEKGKDVRRLPLRERRERISRILQDPPAPFITATFLEPKGWSELREVIKTSRLGNPGFLVLRRFSSRYPKGPSKDWFEWHADPMIIKAVLINVKADRREGLGHPTEYTLGLWKDKGLVPVARIAATSALEDTTALNQWAIQHTTQRFGLTYAVEPSLVLEIAFEGITLSRRHKSGFSLCTPHITRWLKGMHAQEADNLECLTRMASVPCEKTAPTPDIPSTFNLFGKK